uniref:Uncharacterized protein n=1 Tax=Cynoglossus semilaevis TaxID=244447 RepID=A0A3P8WRE2_CYNSE
KLPVKLMNNNTKSSKNTTPKPTTPVHTTPKPTTPVHTTPKPTTPVHTTPKPTTPVHTTPKPTTPGQTTPNPSMKFIHITVGATGRVLLRSTRCMGIWATFRLSTFGHILN